MELVSCKKVVAVSFSSALLLTSLAYPSTNALAQTQCELMPIAIQQDAVANLLTGEHVDELPIGVSVGNYSWLTWVGSPNSPTLANSLLLP